MDEAYIPSDSDADSIWSEPIGAAEVEQLNSELDGIRTIDSLYTEILSALMSPREPKEPFMDTLTDDDVVDMTSTVYELADEYIHENILEMAEPQFHTRMTDDITAILFDQWSDADLCSHGEDDDDPEDDYDDVREFIKNIIVDYFNMSRGWGEENIPTRSYPDSPVKHYNHSRDLAQKIERIRSIPQPDQRTPEWYEFRHGLITASNLYKVFGSEAVCNSLIYEKCLPLKDDTDCSTMSVNTSSPMHWGQKYEPVSIMLYEHLYQTNVEDFGCIQHAQYPYIGASPDGIITDPESNRYGRMLEIKNIVNREIDGVPSKAYWVQMQVQMETCDLDECDFLETRFKEYETEEQFYEGTSERRGVILYFVERVSMGENTSTQQYSGSPKYVYMPFSIELTKTSVDAWIEATRTTMRRSWSLYTPIYWRLDEMSCVLVERNRMWFKHAQPKIDEIWKIIVAERETGYEHRAAKKKIVKLEVVNGACENDSKQIKNLPILGGVCLVKLE